MPPVTHTTMDVVRSVVETYLAAFAKHDAKAIAMLFAPDGVFLPPDGTPLIKGRDAIERSWAELFENVGGHEIITLEDAMPIGDDVIVATDSFKIIGDEANGNKVLSGQAVFVLTKTSEGWRYAALTPQFQPH